MKVGLIGLGRMGEVCLAHDESRHRSLGLQEELCKGQEAFEAGYVSGVTTNLESLVQVVKETKSIYGEKSGETVYTSSPGIFQLVIPAELVEDTLNELLPLLGDGDIIIDHGNSNFKDSRRRAEWLPNLVSNILIAVLRWSLWSGAWILSYGWWCRYTVSVCSPIFESTCTRDYRAPALTHTPVQPVLNTVGCIVADLVQVTL